MRRRWGLPRSVRGVIPLGVVVAVLAGMFVAVPPARAAVRTWDGGGADNLWSTALNWSANTVPVPADTVVFNGTSTKFATIDVNVSVAGISINAGYTGTITQATGTTLTVGASAFVQSAGAFIGGNSAITVNGGFTVNAGGAFTSTGGTLTVTGAVTLAAAVFTHNGGTVAFSTSNVTLNLGGAATFNNVQFLSGTKTIAAGNTMTVQGMLTLAGGTVNQGGATATIAAEGNIDAQAGFTGGSATLLITGGLPQAWSGSQAGGSGLPVVNINKVGGTLTMTGTFRTARNWTWTLGTVAALGSAVTFTGQTISGSHTLGAIELAGGTVTIAAGTTLTADGTLTLTSGTLNQGGATGTLAAKRDIALAPAFVGGSATLLVNGTLPQTWSGSSNLVTGNLNVVNINNPSGTLTLTANLRTGRTWTFTASGGLFASTSSIIFTGQTISGSHTLGAVNLAGGTVTIAAGTTLTAVGTLDLTSGTLNQGGATGTVAAQGDINARVGFSTSGGSATLLINGTGPQAMAGFHDSSNGGLPNVEINKATGVLTITGTLRTGRNWTYTTTPPGGLVVTGSTLIFTDNSSTTISGSHTLNNVDIRGGSVTIAAGTTLTAVGSLTLTSGNLNQGGATGTLAAQGDIFARAGFTGGGTGTLLIDGMGPQTFDGAHSPASGGLPNVDINKTGGVLTITGTLRTGRNWTYTTTPPGGLIVTGSTVIFNGTLTISGDHALNNVEMRSGDVTVTAGDTLTVGGLLTLTDGNLNVGAVDALGDIVLQAAYDGETGTFRIAGVTDQTLTGFADGTTSDMANLVIDKPSGTLHLVGTIRMLTSSWTWLQGAVDPGSSTVYFAQTVTISGTQDLFNVNLSAGTHTVTSGDTLTALGTLTLDSGNINGGTIAGAGDIAQLSTFNGGSGLLAVTGAATQAFSGSATPGAGTLPNVEINKTGGSVTLSGTIRTTNDWTHIAGSVIPGGSTVVFAGGLTIDAGGMPFNDILVNAGTATLASNLTAAGDLTISAGTLAMGSNTVFVAGDVTIDGGLTVTTGTLNMNGLTGQTLGGAAAIGLYDLTVNDPAGVTQTAGVTVSGTLDLGGPLNFIGQTLSIANAITGTPTNLVGDAMSTLIVSGSGSGIILPASLAGLLNLSIDNPNGAALVGPLTVEGTFTLAGGNLDAGSAVLTIGPGGSVVRTSGHVIGALDKWVPVGSAVSLTFEIGDGTTYAPVTVTFGTVSVTGMLTASTTPGEHPNIGTSKIDPARDVNRWWRLTNAGIGFDTVDAAFTFSPADLDAGASPAAFIVGKRDGAWTEPLAAGQTATTITASGMTSLSEFAVGERRPDTPISDTAAPPPGRGSPLPTLLLLLATAASVVRQTRSRAVVSPPQPASR